MSEREYSEAYQGEGAVSRYESEIYAPGSFDDVLWQVERTHLQRLIERHCPGFRQADALDFACGSGRILEYLAPRVGSLVGVDVSSAMLERARPKAPGVEFVCTNIAERPEEVPGDKDLITCFRFLLLAEPELRERCIRNLVPKLRTADSVLIFSLHGNPHSRRALADLRNRLRGSGEPELPHYSLADLRDLCGRVGLRVVDFAGIGYLPRAAAALLPERLFPATEHALANLPGLRHFGSNLLVVCKRSG